MTSKQTFQLLKNVQQAFTWPYNYRQCVVQPFIKSHQILFPLTIECIWGFTD